MPRRLSFLPAPFLCPRRHFFCRRRCRFLGYRTPLFDTAALSSVLCRFPIVCCLYRRVPCLCARSYFRMRAASFLDAFSHLYKRVCPSVVPSVGPSVRRSVGLSVGHTRVEIKEKWLFRCVLASLQEGVSVRRSVRWSVGPSVRPSVGHTQVEFLRNGLNSNEIASGIRKYAI